MYEYKNRIGFSQCDYKKRLMLSELIDIFQDCSTFQSEDVGAGFDFLTEKGLAWVINYWELDIERLPMLCEWVTVGTFPYGMRGFLADRNFYLKDEEGNWLPIADMKDVKLAAEDRWMIATLNNAAKEITYCLNF